MPIDPALTTTQRAELINGVHEELLELIYERSQQFQLTIAECVGVVECVKLQLMYPSGPKGEADA